MGTELVTKYFDYERIRVEGLMLLLRKWLKKGVHYLKSQYFYSLNRKALDQRHSLFLDPEMFIFIQQVPEFQPNCPIFKKHLLEHRFYAVLVLPSWCCPALSSHYVK